MNDLIRLPLEIEPAHIESYLPERVGSSVPSCLRLRPGEKPLLEFISLGLNKNTLEQVVTAVEKGKSIKSIKPESQEANAYLAKILREEVQKQFSEEHRPLVELILNGVDAKPENCGQIYVVDVNVGKHNFSVTDNGKGMNLERVMDTLIIPFSSDKEELRDIGRFGIGFFSDLQYCLQRPNRAKVVVNTSDGMGSYELSVHSKGSNVEDLICSLKKVKSKHTGTTVNVEGINLDKDETCKYLTNYLGFFDPRRAIIRINGSPVNLMRKKSPAYDEYSIPVELEHRGDPVTQDVRVGIDVLSEQEDSKISLYSQGVLIRDYDLRYGHLDIDFPSAVPLVEGRDELKFGPAYKKCLEESIKAIIKYGEDHEDNIWTLMNLREMIPALVDRLVLREGVMDKEEFARVCFPEKTYFVRDPKGLDLSISLMDFFGDDIMNQVYVPKTNTADYFWSNFLPCANSLVSDNVTQRTNIKDKEALEEKMQQGLGRILPNYQELDWGEELHLVSLRNPTETRSPVLCLDRDTYVNVDHPFLQNKGYVGRYGLKTSMTRERIGEKAMEDSLI